MSEKVLKGKNIGFLNFTQPWNINNILTDLQSTNKVFVI